MGQHDRSDVPAWNHFSEFPPTSWTTVFEAVQPDGRPEVRAAQERLLRRYERAIRAYLWAGLRDAHRVDNLYQELGVRLLEGKLQAADPARGRFRHYLKSILHNMVTDEHRRRPGLSFGLPEGLEPSDGGESIELDQETAFLHHWRDEVLRAAWRILDREEREGGKPYHTVLRLRAELEGRSARELAEAVGARLDRAYDEARISCLLHEARERFAALVLETVSETLDRPNLDDLEEELIALNLHRHRTIRRLIRRRRERIGA
jgi:RNA polymerase sigma factor (sigma-70 family)